MNIYFDTEFTGLVPNTTLISLGCVAESGEVFYAEFTDYDKDLITPWIQDNVINNLLFKDGISHREYHQIVRDAFENDELGGSFGRGTSEDVLRELKEWLNNICPEGDRIQFVSDVCHYDFYLLCNLFGGAFSLPENVNPVCYDICRDIPLIIPGDIKWNTADIMWHAFDASREELYKDLVEMGYLEKTQKGAKHNSLYDALIIKGLYEGIHAYDDYMTSML